MSLWTCVMCVSLLHTAHCQVNNQHTDGNTQQQADNGARRPNIVLFMADDLGMGDVGFFGNETLPTPQLDKLASEGVKLSHSIAAASVCTPSRAAFLTGRYPIRMGLVPTNIVRVNMFVSSVSGLPADEVTIAELAQQQGYRTALIGKWHLGVHCSNSQDFCHHPLKQGFDYFYGLPLTNLKDYSGEKGETVVNSRMKGLDNMLATFAVGAIISALFMFKAELLSMCKTLAVIILVAGPTLCFLLISKNLATINGVVMRDYQVVEQPIRLAGFARRLVAEAETFLQQRADDNQPFLLLVPWLQVHTAMHASSAFRGKSKHGPYGDNVMELDWSVGRIVDTLQQLGMEENTVVYFTSDNGGHVEETGARGNREGGYNYPYRGGKAQGGMDGGIRVPTIMKYPGHIPAGSEVNTPVSLMDLYPTLANIMGAVIPSDREIDGVDILPLLTGNTRRVPHELLVHYCGTEIHAARYTPDDGSGSVWKVHFASPRWLPGTEGCGFICDCYSDRVMRHDPPLLYNIATDPSEERLLDPVQNKELLSKISSLVADHEASVDRGVFDQYSVMAMLPRPWLQPCCNFPSCTCTDNNHSHIEL